MYRVVWAQTALNNLTSVWVQADAAERRTITAATRQIDFLLSRNPETQGESRTATERVMFVPPLGVTYDFDPRRGFVRVLHMWSFRRRH
jgi:hypothetical protein